ncbi:MAG: serine/threonine protein kinase [Acidobacteriia bacterium]|nr:serine/threonine protein kinase [Terriglobia bacterium]
MDYLPDKVIDHLRQAVVAPDFSATRYELLGEIGRGGMGTVYVGRDTQLDRRVALKVLNVVDPDREAAPRMADEARILARLEHPGIVPVHDLGTLPDGRIFYAMKLVEGTRLDAYARTSASLPERLRVFLRICETVAFAHSQGVIHRDIKPENIMVGPFGEVLVLDWGVAKIAGLAREHSAAGSVAGSDTASGTVIGTPGYMAPEQAAGAINQVDARSDVYSLGMTLKALAAPSPVPKRLQAISRKAAAQDRSLRYAGVLELSAELERFLAGEPVLAYRESALERLGRLVTRNQTLVLLVAAYLVMRIVLFYVEKWGLASPSQAGGALGGP